MIIIALTLQRCEKFQEEGIDRKKKEFSAGTHRKILVDWVPQALDRTSTGGKKLIQKEELDLSGADSSIGKEFAALGRRRQEKSQGLLDSQYRRIRNLQVW